MGQLRVLVGLRWTMVRQRRVRVGLLVLAASFPALLVAAAVAGQLVPLGGKAFDVLLLAPTLYVAFAVLALVAPLVAGGGNELFPEGQLVAFPVQPSTVFAGSLLMAPLNLAWATQVIVLVGSTAVIAERRPQAALAVITALSYVAFVTVLGQAIAWGCVGLRHGRRGRVITGTVAGLLLLGTGLLVAFHRLTVVLDRSPTRQVVIAAIQGSQGRYRPWLAVTAVVLLCTAIAGKLGQGLCGWALRSAPPAERRELRHLPRRPGRRSMLAELHAVDHASVLRSTSLRRGALVLAVVPGLVAAFAHPTWSSLALLPALVAAGAGLLFGVNAFCLDGAGAVFVATLPHPPRLSLLAKAAVTWESCLVTVLIAVAVTATRVQRPPTVAEAVAVLGSVVGCTLTVVAVCLRLSVERPHKADLRGPRDTPAPPATMAVYSIRLAFISTWAGVLLAGAGASNVPAVAGAASALVTALALRSLVRTVSRWEVPAARARVVSTVAYG